jgi:class 3 adenylate cyclase
MPNYEVKLGSGLHMGYAIEGAIGSYYKIDASYLSPNVNMAARLEGATKNYGVPLLITGSLYKYFTKETKQQCR